MMADAIGAELDKLTFDVTFTAATGDSDLGFMNSRPARSAASSATTGAGSATATWSASASTGQWAVTWFRPSRSSTATSFRCLGCRYAHRGALSAA